MDVNSKDDNHNTAILAACLAGRAGSARCLIDLGASLEGEAEADPLYKGLLFNHGMCLLIVVLPAAIGGSAEVTQLVLDATASGETGAIAPQRIEDATFAAARAGQVSCEIPTWAALTDVCRKLHLKFYVAHLQKTHKHCK